MHIILAQLANVCTVLLNAFGSNTHSLDLQKTFIVAEGRVSSDVFSTIKKKKKFVKTS